MKILDPVHTLLHKESEVLHLEQRFDEKTRLFTEISAERTEEHAIGLCDVAVFYCYLDAGRCSVSSTRAATVHLLAKDGQILAQSALDGRDSTRFANVSVTALREMRVEVRFSR